MIEQPLDTGCGVPGLTAGLSPRHSRLMAGDDAGALHCAIEAAHIDPSSWAETSLLARLRQSAALDPAAAEAKVAEVLALLRMTEQLRSVLALAPQGKCSCTCTLTSSDCGRDSAPCSSGDARMRNDAATAAATDATTGKRPHAAAAGDMPPPAPRRPRMSPPAADVAPAAAAAAAEAPPAAPSDHRGSPPPPAPATGVWRGRLLHRRAGRAAELCSLAVQLPLAYHAQMPPALTATALPHRRAAPLGRHVVARCALLPATTPRQLEALGALAGAQLVATVPLALGELVVVPYFDGRQRIRVVAFLRIPGASAGRR